jgi:hypothetical protein
MNRTLFISGIIIFAIAGFFFMTGHQGIEEIISKFATFSPEKFQLFQTMERVGGVIAVIGILTALAGIGEKTK